MKSFSCHFSLALLSFSTLSTWYQSIDLHVLVNHMKNFHTRTMSTCVCCSTYAFWFSPKFPPTLLVEKSPWYWPRALSSWSWKWMDVNQKCLDSISPQVVAVADVPEIGGLINIDVEKKMSLNQVIWCLRKYFRWAQPEDAVGKMLSAWKLHPKLKIFFQHWFAVQSCRGFDTCSGKSHLKIERYISALICSLVV